MEDTNETIVERKWSPVENIQELRIGDTVCSRITRFPMYVVGIFADSGTLGFQPANFTGTVYADFADNPGDVFEFELADGNLMKETKE